VQASGAVSEQNSAEMSKAKIARPSNAGGSSSRPVRHEYLHRVTFTQMLMQRVCMLEDDAKELYKDLMQSKTG
jgi:hypothetical protein